jgi:uncharacterized protein (DUF433 family)
MATIMSTDTATILLVRTPGTCGGRLRIDGTRMTVNQIASCYKQGASAEDIADQYPHITLAQVYAALAYFHANRSEVEASLAAELEESLRLEGQYKPSLTSTP